MKQFNKYLAVMLLPALSLVGAMVGCQPETGTTTPQPEISFSWANPYVIGTSSNLVEVEALYFIDNLSKDPVSEAGIVLYNKDGDEEIGRFSAAGKDITPLEGGIVGGKFSTKVTGLAPETEYEIEAYVVAGGKTYSSTSRKTIMPGEGGIVDKPSIVYLWNDPYVIETSAGHVTVGASYVVEDAAEDNVTEAGIVLYSVEESSAIGNYKAKEYSSLGERQGRGFVTEITGLTPETTYKAALYVVVGGKTYTDEVRKTITTGAGEADYKITVGKPSASNVTYNSARLSGSWTLTGTATVSEAGFRYRKEGETGWNSNELVASGTANPSTYNWTTATGLEDDTTYEVILYVKIGDATYTTPESDITTFTTSKEPVGEELDQFAWAELPVMKNMDGVSYVTHYVSADGNSNASKTTPGRRRNMTIAFDKNKLQPLWVAYPMHDWYDGSAGRNERWMYDPDIPSGDQSDLSGGAYTGPYSRGHMLASSSRQRSVAMNQQTFYYSNMAPQTQNSFNGGIWLKLENNVEKYYGGYDNSRSDTLFVVTGSVFNGNVTTKDDSGKTLPVPSNFYKAFLMKKNGSNSKSISECSASELQCVAFYFTHKEGYYANNANPSSNEMMKVSDLEDITGFEFFPMLSDEAESVKDSYNASDWGM